MQHFYRVFNVCARVWVCECVCECVCVWVCVWVCECKIFFYSRESLTWLRWVKKSWPVCYTSFFGIFKILFSTPLSGVNFVNVFRTNFLYERRFWQLFPCIRNIHVTRKKAAETMFVRKTRPYKVDEIDTSICLLWSENLTNILCEASKGSFYTSRFVSTENYT